MEGEVVEAAGDAQPPDVNSVVESVGARRSTPKIEKKIVIKPFKSLRMGFGYTSFINLLEIFDQTHVWTKRVF